jgi:hypothetical protein
LEGDVAATPPPIDVDGVGMGAFKEVILVVGIVVGMVVVVVVVGLTVVVVVGITVGELDGVKV